MKLSENKIFIFLIALLCTMSCAAVFSEVMEPDGALYAGIAKRMVLNNDWINLYVNGADWLDKPHLVFWISAFSFKVFGISAFAYKLPSLIAVFAGAWYLYMFANILYNKRTALISVVIFLSFLHLLVSNFDVRAEGYLCAFIMAAIYHYYKAQDGSFLHIAAGSLFAAAAVMSKGIFVIAPIIAGFVIYWIFIKQYRQLSRPRWWLAALLILIFIVPELYALHSQFDLHPEKVVFGETGVSGIRFFFWDGQFGRFFNNGPIKGKGDVSFFLHTALWALLPWSVLFYTAVASLFKKKYRDGQPAESIIVWSSAAVTFLIFSFSRFQLPHYLVILFPQFAIITALFLISMKENALRIFSRIQNGIFILVAVLLIAITLLFRFPYEYFFAGILLFLTATAFLLFKRPSIVTLLARGTLLATGLMIFLYLFFYPALLKYQAGMLAGKWLKENYPMAEPGVLSDANAFAFGFYAPGIVRYFPDQNVLEKTLSDKMRVVYTPESELQKLRKNFHVAVLKELAHYRITRLKLQFLNFKTRDAVLERYYLVRIGQRRLQRRLKIQRCHLAPVSWSVSIAFPKIKLVWNILVPQQLAEFFIDRQKGVCTANGKDQIQLPDRREYVLIGQVGHVLAGHIKVDAFIVVTVKQVSKIMVVAGQVISSADAYSFFKGPGMFERNIDGMISTHAAAC